MLESEEKFTESVTYLKEIKLREMIRNKDELFLGRSFALTKTIDLMDIWIILILYLKTLQIQKYFYN